MSPRPSLVLGLDLGTSSVKALLVDAELVALDRRTAAYGVDVPARGWAETSPQAWWRAIGEAVRALPDELRASVGAIGLAGQMHGVALVDASGAALRPAILWSDVRSTEALEAYRRLPEGAQARLANPLVVGMAGPSLVWLARHEPGAVRRARWALQPKDWLRLRLTGEVASDASDASATLLFDLLADGWDEEVVRALGLEPRLLPPLLPSDAVAGRLRRDAAAELGIPAGIPVATGAGDTAAALLGAGRVATGDGLLNLGTGAQIVVVAAPSKPTVRPTTHLFRTALAGQYYRMAAMQNAGLALGWVRGILGIGWDELYGGFAPERLDPGLVFLPYLTGERTPLLDPSARGAWSGLGLHHRRSDLASAALAGVALAIRNGYGALVEAGASPARLGLSGGGTRSPAFNQFLCDLLGVPLEPVPTADATALGAAALALRALTGAPRVPSAEAAAPLRPRPLPPPVLAAAECFRAARRRWAPGREA